MPKIFIIACEASGDQHGADLVHSIKRINPAVEFEGLGGPEMRKAGVPLLEDVTRISVLGFGDVLQKYFHFRRIFYRALKRVQAIQPNLLILIDSPAFNLRFAKKIRRLRLRRTRLGRGIPVLYYISPQIWAWGWRRIHTIRKTVDQMMVILPFEEAIYRREKIPCRFVGHPLLDRVKPSKSRTELRQELGLQPSERMIALLPGSREPEVRRILPLMLQTAQRLVKEIPDLKFFMTQAPHVSSRVYDEILQAFRGLSLQRPEDRLYDIVTSADFALVASGTATLETALLGTPYFLLYKASASTFFIGRLLVRIPYLGIVNVLAGRVVVPEFIQHLAQPERIAHETKRFLENSELREKLRKEIREVCEKLGTPGASDRAARLVVEKLNEIKPPQAFETLRDPKDLQRR